MAHKKNNTNLTELLLQCVTQPDPKLIISDAHPGLVSAIRASFPGTSWQRCKVHFMRNILAYVPQKEKKSFACVLKEIWLAPTAELARKRAYGCDGHLCQTLPKGGSVS